MSKFIRKERKREKDYNNVKKKRESGGCKFVGAGDNFSPRRRINKRSLT